MNKIERRTIIASQMIKGSSRGIRTIPQEKIDAFILRYGGIIEWLMEVLPREVGAPTAAAIGKAALWYGKEKMDKFCKALANCEFDGADDPVHALWLWLGRNRTCRNSNEVYRRSVGIIRAYIEGRKAPSNGYLLPCKTDIFEWGDENYETMYKPRQRNQHKKKKKDVKAKTVKKSELTHA